jgi:hypothetical protein
MRIQLWELRCCFRASVSAAVLVLCGMRFW